MDGYQALGNAVAIQAAKDYTKAARYIDAHKGERSQKMTNARKTVKEVEEFFLSDWFKVLSGCDGAKLFNEIKRKALL